jgi:Zn-dependent protease
VDISAAAAMLIQIAVLVFGVIIHEVSHGFMAHKLGDPTAKDLGRLTLNPLSHIDPFMSIILPAILILTHAGFIIGGAKPVPFNPMYFKKQRRDIMLTSLAGPVSNLLLAIIAALLLLLLKNFPGLSSYGLTLFLGYNVVINIGLAVFNLLPIPPLDGSKVLIFFLPPKAEMVYLRFEAYGMIVLLILLATGLLNAIFVPISGLINNLLNFLM